LHYHEKLTLRIAVTLSAVTILCCLLFGCASPEAIGNFADSAQKGIAGGPPVFTDIHDSCLRRQMSRPGAPILPIFVPPGSKDAPPENPPAIAACARFAAEAQALTKVSDVLNDYFKSMQNLASFNASGVSGASESVAENVSTAAGVSSAQIESAGKLATLLTRIATESYQRKRLVQLLRDADPEVTNITEGFDKVTSTYLDLLQQEQQTLAAEYQSVGETARQPAMLLLLNRAYSEDLDKLQQRRSEGNAYRGALKNIREGHHKLVEDAPHLSAKEVNAALEPYISSLNGLVPALAKKK
jgi:hypothetical protein